MTSAIPNVDEAILAAIRADEIDVVKTILDTQQMENMYSFLMYAIRTGNLAMVQLLRAKCENVDNDEPFQEAVSYGHLNVVRFLYDKGCDLWADDDYAIKQAARFGYLDVIRYLHEQGADISADFNTPLQLAAANGHLDVIRYLHANGVDILASNHYTITEPAKYDHLDVIRFLHQNGFDINTNDNLALKLAAKHGHLAVVRYFYTNSAHAKTLADLHQAFKAAVQDQDSKMAHAIQIEAYYLRINRDYNYALVCAAGSGHLDVVQYLHAIGAKITGYDNYALKLAAENGHLAVVEFLHAKGLDLMVNDNYAVKIACHFGRLDVVRFLHAKGADLLGVESYHSNITPYIQAQKWLLDKTSLLCRCAARVFVAHYALPNANLIPTHVMDILVAANA